MSVESMIDDYITKEPEAHAVGTCNHCGDIIYSGQEYVELENGHYCNEGCVSDYYEVEEHTVVEYCTECEDVIEESYIKDIYDNKFCDLKCLIKYYK